MKKKMQWKDFLLLQVVFLIYSFTSLTQKLASSFLPKDAGTTEELVRQLLNWKLILSAGLVVLLLGVYALLWQQVIKRFELSVAYANKAITLLWALVWGIFIFHEEITPGKVIGILLVMAGIYVLNTGERPKMEDHQVVEHQETEEQLETADHQKTADHQGTAGKESAE